MWYSGIMNPITHGLIGWTGGAPLVASPRDHVLVTLSSLLADIDGLGFVIDLISPDPAAPTKWYSLLHHQFGHNATAALVISGLLAVFATHRGRTFLLSLLFFHLHLLCDIVGSKGPDGYQWPIPYLYPFSNDWQWTWSGQWEVNAWPNLALTVVLLGVFLWQTRRLGYSPLFLISARADQAFVDTLRQRFPLPPAEPAPHDPADHP